MRKAIALLVAVLVLLQAAYANGGFIKLAENNHLVSASLAPISPDTGEKQTIVVSFVYNFSLIKEKISANVTVKKNDKTISFQAKKFTGGVESFEVVYPQEGIYEVFVEFVKESEPDRVYAPEDFLVQVKNGGVSRFGWLQLMEIVSAAAIALVFGWVVGRKTK